jgi:hypothetical protein
MPCPAMLWVYVNAHSNTKLVFNPMPVYSGTDLSSCYPALTWVSMVHLSDQQLTWVWCNVPMNTTLLTLETRVDAFLWFGSAYEYLQTVLVYGRTWYIWIVVIISEYWDWKWTTYMKTNDKILSDVTPSYALMRSNRRGLWWIYNEFKPLPAYTKMVVSLWFSFEDFSQVFPMRVLRGLYWMVHDDDDFCPSFFPVGVSGFIFQCAIQHGILSIGIPYWLQGSVWWYHTVDGLVVLVTKAMLNGWLWRSEDVR